MIYPKCYDGMMSPFITFEGYLHPCCQVNYFSSIKNILSIDNEYIKNPFNDDAFSLYKNKYSEIIESEKWNHLINNLYKTKIRKCWSVCSSNEMLINSPMVEYNKKIERNNNNVKTKHINTIQIETSNRCTLGCPYCLRKTHPPSDTLNKYDISLDILYDVFKYKNWNSVVDCGSYGDPIYYKKYHEMLTLINECVIKNYRVNIAATGRTKKWWDKTHYLWKELHDSGTNVTIHWGIDGLENTSKIHRINQDWNEITTNMKIASKNGIECFWQYIPMSFNEHQIYEAKKLAEEWGVKFKLTLSDRFSKNDKMKPKNKKYYFDILVNGNIHTINKG